MFTRPSLVVAVIACASCVDFDLAEQIEDTRILGVRNEPAEIMFSPLFLLPQAQRPPLPIPTVTVNTEVYAYDPRYGSVTLKTQLCPEGAGDSSCRLYDKDFDRNFARLTEPTKSEVEALLAPRETTIDADQTTAAGRITTSFSYDVTPGVIDFFQPKNAAGDNVPSIFPLLPRMVVAAENSTQKVAGADVFAERAFKRLPLLLDLADPSLGADFTNNLANVFGISLCNAPLPTPEEKSDDEFEGRADCLASRPANRNPPLKGFRIESATTPSQLTEGLLEGEPDLFRMNSVVRVSPGGVLALTPMWQAGASERYQIISFDIESSLITIINRQEDLACTWYSTRGTVSEDITAKEFTNNRYGIIWNLPPDARSGERDSLVLVVLDQRGGTTVGEVNVEYR